MKCIAPGLGRIVNVSSGAFTELAGVAGADHRHLFNLVLPQSQAKCAGRGPEFSVRGARVHPIYRVLIGSTRHPQNGKIHA